MEAAVETADSMTARGYGTKRRTTFPLFRFDGRAARTLGLILAVAGICITCLLYTSPFPPYSERCRAACAWNEAAAALPPPSRLPSCQNAAQ